VETGVAEMDAQTETRYGWSYINSGGREVGREKIISRQQIASDCEPTVRIIRLSST